MITAQDIATVHRAHPDWTGVRIAGVIGCGRGFVYKAATKLQITLPQAKKGPKAHGE
jgi:hypothetical protein